jgi:hypothetical protein
MIPCPNCGGYLQPEYTHPGDATSLLCDDCAAQWVLTRKLPAFVFKTGNVINHGWSSKTRQRQRGQLSLNL